MVLILETVPHSDPKAKKKLFTVISTGSLCQSDGGGVQLVHACLTHCVHPGMISCHTDVPLVCSRSIMHERSAASMMFSQRLVLNVQNVQNAALRASEIPYPATQAAKASFTCHSAPLPDVRRPSVHVVARRE